MIGKCQNCGEKQTPIFEAKDENRKVGYKTFYYSKCEACKLISLQNYPEDIADYYENSYYRIPNIKRLKRLAERQGAKMNAITPYCDHGKLLEVGPAFGVFAYRAKLHGFKVSVIERDPRCCTFLSEELGLDVIQHTRPEQALEVMPSYDVIALWHVIEHLESPFKFFDQAIENLSPGGILVLGTPNPDSKQFKLMKSAWPHLDAPRHFHLIPADVLIERGRQKGMELCLLTSDDADAQSWNKFGWQRLIMNRAPGKLGKLFGLFFGACIASILAPFERHNFNGSAYTLCMKKMKES